MPFATIMNDSGYIPMRENAIAMPYVSHPAVCSSQKDGSGRAATPVFGVRSLSMRTPKTQRVGNVGTGWRLCYRFGGVGSRILPVSFDDNMIFADVDPILY